ncbi:hypothetical protein Q4542_20545, partial [Saccharophagus degradans]|nr:hypothetical protein [Saccharophagus degradans]
QKSRQKKKEKWILLRSQLGLRSCEAYNIGDVSDGALAALGVLGATSFVASAAVGAPVLAGLGAFWSSAGAVQLVYKSFGSYIKRM